MTHYKYLPFECIDLKWFHIGLKFKFQASVKNTEISVSSVWGRCLCISLKPGPVGLTVLSLCRATGSGGGGAALPDGAGRHRPPDVQTLRHAGNPELLWQSGRGVRLPDPPIPQSTHHVQKSCSLHLHLWNYRYRLFLSVIICSHDDNNISQCSSFVLFVSCLCFRSPQSSCGQSEPPLNGSGCFIVKRCDV